jgi:hypothetical protein
VTSLLSLQYPNGRTHEMESAQEMRPGQEFELYGHHWMVVGRVGRARGRQTAEQLRLLCRQSR